jgi:uncharacterized membrane protein
LRKAVLRSAGVIALHDETRAFEKQRATLVAAGAGKGAFDLPGFLTSFQAVVVEGLEVVFIVVAVGATAAALVPAIGGAVLAGITVIALGVAVRAPLSRIPENALKFVVGLFLSAFGTFWLGEGIGAAWPGDDLSLLALVIAYALAAILGVALARGARAQRQPVA